MRTHDAAFLTGIVGSMTHPIFVRDRERRFVLVNAAFAELVGRSECELSGRTAVEAFGAHEAPVWCFDDDEVLSTGAHAQRDDALITSADGSRHYVSITKVGLTDDAGAITHIIGMLHDITRLRSLTAELQRTKEDLERRVEARGRELADAQAGLVRKERLAVLGQLAGGMAHQIRNPLGAIKNAAYVLERHVSAQAGDEGPWALSIIHDEVKRANQIITHLLDYARVRAPIIRSVDVAALVEQVLADRTAPPQIRVVRRFAPVPPLAIDADQVHGALSNLVDNALEAMGDDPDAREPVLTVEIVPEGDVVLVAVSDSGPGVAPEIAGHLFEPLFTTKPLGLGLGLVTARTLIEEQGGTLSLASAGRRGARFEVRLPLASSRD